MADTGTFIPAVPLQFFDNNGDPANGALLFTYLAGTTTKESTFTTSTISGGGEVANANPVVLDSSGRATVFLDPSKNMKFVLAPSTDTDPPASPYWSRDNISANSFYDISTTIATGTATAAAWGTSGKTQTLTIPRHPVIISCQSSQTAPVTVDIPAGTLGTNGDVIVVEWEVGYSSGTHAARLTAFGANHDLGTGGASVATRAKFVIQRAINTDVNVFQTVFQATSLATGLSTTGTLDLDSNAYTIEPTMDGGTPTTITARMVYYPVLDDWTD